MRYSDIEGPEVETTSGTNGLGEINLDEADPLVSSGHFDDKVIIVAFTYSLNFHVKCIKTEAETEAYLAYVR